MKRILPYNTTRLVIFGRGMRVRLAVEGPLNRHQRRTITLALMTKIVPEIPGIHDALWHFSDRSPMNLAGFDAGLAWKYATFLGTAQQRFGFQIRMRRNAARMTQAQMGRVLGLSRSYVSLMEKGRYKPQRATRFKIKQILGIDYPEAPPEQDFRTFRTT